MLLLSRTDCSGFGEYGFVMAKKLEHDINLIAFSERMNEVCDDMGVPPKGHNRQATLGRLFKVTQKGARKWLVGEGYPKMSIAIEIAKWARINIQWLLMGEGPKKPEIPYSEEALAIAKLWEEMPEPERVHIRNIMVRDITVAQTVPHLRLVNISQRLPGDYQERGQHPDDLT